MPVAYMEGRGEDIPAKHLRAYQRAKAIGVMNYWVYFNQNPAVDPADLIVMDDAHLAEQCLDSLYSIVINRKDHEPLFEAIIQELYERFPGYTVLSEAVAKHLPPTPNTSTELLSFIDHAEFAQRLIENIDASPFLESDTDLRFRWRRLRNKIHLANFYISRDALWLRPYIYPLTANEHYENAEQVLYLSATIGDPGDLARRLGTRSIKKVEVPEHFADRSSGRRLIVMNRMNDDSDIPDRMALALLHGIRTHCKSLWLCASEREANHLREAVGEWLEKNQLVGHPTWILTPLGDEIDQFRKAGKGHLFVAGRFDGMDFSGDECRIVVLSTMPRAINLQEEFISSYLRDSGFMRTRLNQRVVQGLGRCTRTDDDFGVCFLADQRFSTHFSRDSNREGMPKHIKAELDLAQDLAELEENKLVEYVEKFLRGDFNTYDTDLGKLQEDVPVDKQSKSTNTSKDEVKGWTALFDSGNFRVAKERFEQCWNIAKKDNNLLEIAAFHGWHRAKALYLEGLQGNQSALNQSLQVLEEAIQRGGMSSWFNLMRGSLNRVRARENATENITKQECAEAIICSFDEKLERLGTKGPKFQKYIDWLEAKLNSTSHAEYQEALELLGAILGFRAWRPQHGASADCVWRGELGNSRELIVFEAKIEHEPSNLITATHLGQAHTQYSRAKEEYENRGYSIRAVVVTHLNQLAPDAQSALGPIRLIKKDVILALWSRVRTIMTAYRSEWDLDDIKTRRLAATAIRPKLPSTGWLLQALDKADPWLSESDVLKGWSAPS